MNSTLVIGAATAIVIASLASLGRSSCRADPDASRPKLKRAILRHAMAFAAVYVALLFWGVETLLAETPPADRAESASSEGGQSASGGLSVGEGLGMLGIALATGVSVLGASYAVAVVGSAALGAITEKPELFGRALVFIGLAEGLAIYGLIISILMLGRLG